METAVVQSTEQRSALPTAWIERLFERLGMIYGSEKIQALWRGQEIEDVKRYWAMELAPFHGDELRAGFSRLAKEHPSWPPTLYEFMDLCRSEVKQEAYKALPRPEVDKSEIHPRIAELQSKLTSTPRLAWAEKIKEREKAGDKTLYPIAVKMAHDAERIAAGGRPC